MNRYLSLLGRQAGKWTFTMVWKGNEIIAALKTGAIRVNPNAQRTLAKGANTTPTHQLVDQDKVHDTPRMKSLVQFLGRVMDNVEKGNLTEGFLGAVLTVIPEDFHDARWVPLDIGQEAPNRVGYLIVEDAGLDQAAFHVGDGQGRLFGLYSMEFVAKKAVGAKHKEIEKARKAKADARQLEKELAEREALLKRIQKFIRELQLSFVCYARSVRDDGTVVGLDETAQRRLFVEGNALNSKAGKEVQLKFDTVSPIGTALYLLRVEPEYFWMDPNYIEENSKSIAKGSSKLFTLSALNQAYGWSVANTTKVQRLDDEAYETVGKNQAFAAAYWRKVTEVFGPLWRRTDTVGDGEWLEYLGKRRAEQNVAFQAIFLQALGRLGYNLGVSARWNPESPLLTKMSRLSPTRVDYRAFKGRFSPEDHQIVTDLAADFNSQWTNALMKPRTGQEEGGKATGKVVGYAFNNVSDSISKTYRALLDLAEVPDAAEAPTEEPEEDVAEEAEIGA
jgi:hypothetical protein